MLLEPLVERLGESGVLALGAVVIGTISGLMAQRSCFGLRSAVIEFARNQTGGQLAVRLFAFATAVGVTQALAWWGWFDAGNARQIVARGSLSGAAVGGGLSGAGMILARGCSSRLPALAAQGNLRSLLSGRIVAVTAQSALTGAPVFALVWLVAAIAWTWRQPVPPWGWAGAIGVGLSIAGAMCMGFGGMLAGGCAVGASLSVAAIFTATAWVTLCAMWAAAAITGRIIDQRPSGVPDQPVPGSGASSFGSGHFV